MSAQAPPPLRGEKCLVPDCSRGSGPRGLCPSHQATAKALIVKKLTTWEALEAAGKARPKVSVRSKIQRWFLDGLPTKAGQVRPDDRGRLPQDPSPEEIRARAALVRSERGRAK